MRAQGPKDYFKPHSSNVICDRCGFKAKSDDLIREWNGLMVHRFKCHEPRNQQDFLKGMPDNLPRPYYRPEPEEIFIDNPANPVSLIP